MNRPAWMRALANAFGFELRGGSLCDETDTGEAPAALPAPDRQPVVPPVPGRWVPRDDGEYDRAAGPECKRCTELTAQLRKARIEAMRTAVRAAQPPLSADVRDLVELRGQLAEALAERDEEARINNDLRHANDSLRRRIDGLELTLRAMSSPPPATTRKPKPHDHGGDLLTPWPRARP